MTFNQKIICTVTNDLNQDQRMQRICTTLTENGYTVTLVGRLKAHSIPLQIQNYHQIRLKCWYDRGFLFYLEYNIRLFRILLSEKKVPFIIYTVDSDTLVAGGIVKYLTGKKQIFDAHEYFTEVPELINKPIKRWIWQTIENIFVPKADAHITVSKSLADIFGNKFGKIFTPILNVPYLSVTSGQAKKPYLPVILYQGMLNKGRGLEQMIGAMEKINYALLFIIGEGDLSASLRLLGANSPAANRIQFLGWKSADQMAEISREATLAINLLENSSLSYYYSLANKFFDYIHAGVPSVNMAFPEYIDIIKKYELGVTISKLDQDLIAETINNLLGNHETLEQMVVACKKACKIYCWENERQKLIETVDQMHLK